MTEEQVRMYAEINNKHFDLDSDEMEQFLRSFGLLGKKNERLELMKVLEKNAYNIVGHVTIREGSMEKKILKILTKHHQFYLPEDILIDLDQERELIDYKSYNSKKGLFEDIFE